MFYGSLFAMSSPSIPSKVAKTPSLTPQAELPNPRAHHWVWVLDSWTTLDHAADTTLRLIQWAHQAGIIQDVVSIDSALNGAWETKSTAKPHLEIYGRRVQFTDGRSLNVPNLSALRPIDLSEPQHWFYRIDPPVNLRYKSFVEILVNAGVPHNRFVNSLGTLRTLNEKQVPLELTDFAPDTLEVLSSSSLNDVTPWAGKNTVIKPKDGLQSRGVTHVPALTVADVEQALARHPAGIVLQEFLPEITTEGEIRFWFVAGECVGTLRKRPAHGDFKFQYQTGTLEAVKLLSSVTENFVNEVGKSLNASGIRLAAIDAVWHRGHFKIIDWNVSSPGLLAQLCDLTYPDPKAQEDFGRRVITRLK